MNKFMISCFVLLLAVALILPNSHSVVPDLMNYQGVVMDSTGASLDGNYSIIFKIFNSSAGGTLLWSETHPSVTVSDGLFNVILGSQGSALSQSTFSGSAAWLEVVVDGETISPRTRFTTSAYSHRVTTVDGADGGDIIGNLTVSGNIKATGPIDPLGGIITPAGILIQSTANDVVVIAGSSVITVHPSGGVTIVGSDVAITATDELIFSANNKVTIDAPWVDLHSADSTTIASNAKIRMTANTSITAQAGTNFNTSSGNQTNITSSSTTNVSAANTLDLTGALVTIN